MSTTKLQIVSDVHLEFLKKSSFPNITPHAANLALLGDIGKPFLDTYKDFLEVQSKAFKNVFVLMGNHEYYNSSKTVEVILAKARDVCSLFPNVHLLERDTYDITDNTRILGCTLWSMINAYSAKCMNDFEKIKIKNNTAKMALDRPTYVSWHIRDVAWLNSEISKAKTEGKKVVVLTHHGALLEMSGQYVGSAISSAFVSDLRHLFCDPVIAFASGHVHSNVDVYLNNIRSVSNALGYPGEKGTEYKENITIDFP